MNCLGGICSIVWAWGLVYTCAGSDGLNLVVRDGYLPEVPVLVRVELIDSSGAIRRDQWDAVAMLTADDPTVHAEPNRVHLYNGVGSALVTLSGGGDFRLTADVNGVMAAAPLVDRRSRRVHPVSGRLDRSATWRGVYHITGGDFTIAAGATLTLAPGTLVLIDGVAAGSDGTDIQVEGSIQSLGTPLAPVTFTAAQPGLNWGELRFVDAEPSTFRYTEIMRAGRSPRVGHSNSGPAIRAQGSAIVFEYVSFTDNAGKVMHATSGCDLVFRHCLLARSVMGPEIAGTALLFEDSWITEMHAADDADAIYIHSQQAGQQCLLSRGVIADVHDDGLDTLGSQVTMRDFIIRDCRDKGASVYAGTTTIDHCLIVENNTAPEDTTNAVVVAKAFENGTAEVNIDRTTIVATRRPGYTDVAIQSHNKYGVTSGSIVWHVTGSIINATVPVDVQLPYLAADVHIDYCGIADGVWPRLGNVFAPPLFMDAANHDYRLSAESSYLGAADDGADPGYYGLPQPPDEVTPPEEPPTEY